MKACPVCNSKKYDVLETNRHCRNCGYVNTNSKYLAGLRKNYLKDSKARSWTQHITPEANKIEKSWTEKITPEDMGVVLGIPTDDEYKKLWNYRKW
jgi:transcription initiation factor TFIIIB Brf1 subunit/transcription initiation factor TFIIB